MLAYQNHKWGGAAAELQFPTLGTPVVYNSGAVASDEISFSTPGGLVAGDLLLAILAPAHGDNLPMTPPAGFTQIWEGDVSDSDSLVSGAYYRICTGDEAGSYSWGLSAANRYPVGVLLPVFGAHGSAPIFASAGPKDDWETVLRQEYYSSPSLAAGAKNRLIHFGLAYIGQRDLTCVSGTEVANVTSTGSNAYYAEMILGTSTQENAGASTPFQFRDNAGGNKAYWTAATIAIAPAPAS